MHLPSPSEGWEQCWSKVGRKVLGDRITSSPPTYSALSFPCVPLGCILGAQTQEPSEPGLVGWDSAPTEAVGGRGGVPGLHGDGRAEEPWPWLQIRSWVLHFSADFPWTNCFTPLLSWEAGTVYTQLKDSETEAPRGDMICQRPHKDHTDSCGASLPSGDEHSVFSVPLTPILVPTAWVDWGQEPGLALHVSGEGCSGWEGQESCVLLSSVLFARQPGSRTRCTARGLGQGRAGNCGPFWSWKVAALGQSKARNNPTCCRTILQHQGLSPQLEYVIRTQ